MKNKKILNIALVILLITGIATIVLVFSRQKPLPERVIPERVIVPEKAEAPQEPLPVAKKAEEPIAPIIIEEKKVTEEEEVAAPAEEEKAEEEQEKQPARFSAEPAELVMEAEEGGSAKAEFTLTNEGAGTGLFNIYKTDDDSGIGQKTDAFMEHKIKNLPETPTAGDLRSCGLFTGAPWLVQFPYYGSIEPGQALQVKVTAHTQTGDLEAGEYRSNLVILGLDRQESLVVPVYLTVTGAPRLRFAKLEVDDGFSPDTKGNQNNVANPSEIAAFTIYLDNAGGMRAEGLTLAATSEYGDSKVLGDGTVKVAEAASNGQLSGRFLIQVNDDASPTYPPSIVVTTTDSKGRQWTENFYVGEEGKFNYPTGLILEEEQKEE